MQCSACAGYRTSARTWTTPRPVTDLDSRFGERAMMKVKRIRTADCVVGGFRYAQGSELVGSLLLGLYNEKGVLDHVGFTSAFAKEDKKALTARLEKLVGRPASRRRSGRLDPLGDGAFQPNGSRSKPSLLWKGVLTTSQAERFRHGTRLLRWRPDKAPKQCTTEQIR